MTGGCRRCCCRAIIGRLKNGVMRSHWNVPGSEGPDLLRKSYQVICVYRGGEEAAAAAGLLTGKVTRYGKLLDFNRKD